MRLTADGYMERSARTCYAGLARSQDTSRLAGWDSSGFMRKVMYMARFNQGPFEKTDKGPRDH
jgi:hypothetical protein